MALYFGKAFIVWRSPSALLQAFMTSWGTFKRVRGRCRLGSLTFTFNDRINLSRSPSVSPLAFRRKWGSFRWTLTRDQIPAVNYSSEEARMNKDCLIGVNWLCSGSSWGTFRSKSGSFRYVRDPSWRWPHPLVKEKTPHPELIFQWSPSASLSAFRTSWGRSRSRCLRFIHPMDHPSSWFGEC